jgi:hypothetical protein
MFKKLLILLVISLFFEMQAIAQRNYKIWIGEHNNYMRMEWMDAQFEYFSERFGNVT